MRPVTWLKLFKDADPLEWSPEPVCCCSSDAPEGFYWVSAGCRIHGLMPAQRTAERQTVRSYVDELRRAA